MTGGPQQAQLLGRHAAVAVVHLEEQALEVRRDLDVHARAQRRDDVGGRHDPGRQEASEDVVAVGTDQETVDRRTGAQGDPARQDVAEVAGGDGERHRPTAERRRGGCVVDDLGHDPGPVDGVHRGEVVPVPEGGVVEHGLHEVLAVVERPLHRDGLDVLRGNRRHLPSLHLADPALGVEDDDVDVGPPGHGVDRRAARVTAGRPDDGDPLGPLREDMVEQPADDLQRHVLERQRRPVEQLQQPIVGTELHEGTDGRVAERLRRGIGVGADGVEHCSVDLVADVRRHDRGRGGGVARARVDGRQRRPRRRYVEAAVGGETGQQRVGEAQLRCAPPGGDVAHGYDLSRR